LIRIWIRDEELAWKTPEPLIPQWERLYKLEPDEQRFPLDPEIRTKAGGIAR
jgi:hypothetical protein